MYYYTSLLNVSFCDGGTSCDKFVPLIRSEVDIVVLVLLNI